MKDRRFKELINLYLDNEISMSEAAELEAELHCNPVRREEYHDYCRLQRGCSTLFETECSRAPASFALHRASAMLNGASNGPRRRLLSGNVVNGGLMAAPPPWPLRWCWSWSACSKTRTVPPHPPNTPPPLRRLRWLPVAVEKRRRWLLRSAHLVRCVLRMARCAASRFLAGCWWRRTMRTGRANWALVPVVWRWVSASR